MIAADQPTIFPNNLLVAVSSVQNGTIRHPAKDPAAPQYIAAWCRQLGIPQNATAGLYITYGDARSYTEIKEVNTELCAEGAVSEQGWVKADALITSRAGLALILPVADCNAVTVYDSANKVLALAHLGWHATVNNLASVLVGRLRQSYGTNLKDVLVSFSPSIRKDSYIFDTLKATPITDWHQEPYATKQADGRYKIDLLAYNLDQFIQAGVAPGSIEISPVDTATSDNYFSHFARHTLGDHHRTKGRFAVLAMMR